jgi:aspartate aminotransferase
VPSVLPRYEHSCLVGSLAKNMSLPGIRLGYMAVNPAMPGKEDFMAAAVFGNMALGVTAAPVIGQKLLKYCLGHNTDASVYAKRRQVMADMLTRAGYEFNMPDGAFYFFPKAPGGDDKAFTQELMKHRVLAVPGCAFGAPGYFRLCFCVSETVIERAFEGLKKAREAIEKK